MGKEPRGGRGRDQRSPAGSSTDDEGVAAGAHPLPPPGGLMPGRFADLWVRATARAAELLAANPRPLADTRKGRNAQSGWLSRTRQREYTLLLEERVTQLTTRASRAARAAGRWRGVALRAHRRAVARLVRLRRARRKPMRCAIEDTPLGWLPGHAPPAPDLVTVAGIVLAEPPGSPPPALFPEWRAPQ